MALVPAVALGAIAAIAVPYVTRDETGMAGGWLKTGAMQADIAGYHLFWSWPIFCIVTLAAWTLVRAGRGS